MIYDKNSAIGIRVTGDRIAMFTACAKNSDGMTIFSGSPSSKVFEIMGSSTKAIISVPNALTMPMSYKMKLAYSANATAIILMMKPDAE